MLTAIFVGNTAPHSAIGMQLLYRILHGMELNMWLLWVISVRGVVRVETYTKKLELKKFQGRLLGYSNSSKQYGVYNPITRRIMKSSNVVFIETPSPLLPPPLKQSWMQSWGHRQVGSNKSHNYITDDDFLRNIRDYTSMVELFPGASTDRITAGGRLESPQVAE